jgi:hypothetical protein
MEGHALLALLVRACATGLFVLGMAWLVARGRPLVAAIAIGLPVVLGPGFLLLALDHDPAFVAEAARSSLATLAATIALIVTVAATLPRLSAAPMLLAGCAAWAGASLVGQWIGGTQAGAVLLYGAAFALSGLLPAGPAPGGGRARLPPRWVLAARTLAAGGLVALVTVLADRLGPGPSGALLTFPVGITFVAWGLKQDAPPATARGVLIAARFGTLALAAFLLVVLYGAERLGALPAVAAALVASVAVAVLANLARAALLRRGARTAIPSP